MKLMASKCGSLDGPAELLDDLARLRVGDEQVDARTGSGSRRTRTSLPSGLSVGARLKSPLRVEADERSCRRCPGDCVRRSAAGTSRGSPPPSPSTANRLFSPSTRTSACIPAEAQRGAVDVDDRAIAPASADVGPQRLAVAVREEARIGGQLLDRRELVRASTASRIHIAVSGSSRPSEKYSAMPSMSQSGSALRRIKSAARRSLGDVVLEDVHQLVAEHVIVVRVDAGERHDDARPIRFRDAARSLLELPRRRRSSARSPDGRRRRRATCGRTRAGRCPSGARTSAPPCGRRRGRSAIPAG